MMNFNQVTVTERLEKEVLSLRFREIGRKVFVSITDKGKVSLERSS
jgi:hypothetical protein